MSIFSRFAVEYCLRVCKFLGQSFGTGMFAKRNSIEKVTEMGCCGCFGFSFLKSPKKVTKPSKATSKNISEELLLHDDPEDEQGSSFQNDDTDGSGNADDLDFQSPAKRSHEILTNLIQHELICREFPVKETDSVFRSEVSCRASICLCLFLKHIWILFRYNISGCEDLN